MRNKIIFFLAIIVFITGLIFLLKDKEDVKVLSETKDRDSVSLPEPKIESLIPGNLTRTFIKTENNIDTIEATVYKVEPLAFKNKEERKEMAKIFELNEFTEGNLDGNNSFFLETENLDFNTRLIFSGNNSSITYSKFSKKEPEKGIKQNVNDWKTKVDALVNEISLPEDWKINFEKLVYYKNGDESAIFADQSDFDFVIFYYYYSYKDKPVYSSNGHPLVFTYNNTGLNYATITFIPTAASVKAENLKIKNKEVFKDSSQYKVIGIIADQNYWTYDRAYKTLNNILSSEISRNGYYYDEKLKELWPYIFVNGLINNKYGKAQVLFGSSLIL